MQHVWESAPIAASALAAYALESFGWKKNTTYTVIKRLIERGALARSDPGFLITPLVTREQTLQDDTSELIEKRYGGSRKLFLTSFLSGEDVSEEELALLRQAIDEKEKQQ